jgi:prepilin-type N-terminal cleavage/methylation domain-containing protein
MLRKSQKGFTLIELGIVIAVIAILATVVLVGKGFIASSKVSKGVECLNAARIGASTYVGTQGGTVGTNAADLTTTLSSRSLMSFQCGPGLSISSTTGVMAQNAQVAFQMNCKDSAGQPDPTTCQDISTNAGKDPNFVGPPNTSTVAGETCSDKGTLADGGWICFNLF